MCAEICHFCVWNTRLSRTVGFMCVNSFFFMCARFWRVSQCGSDISFCEDRSKLEVKFERVRCVFVNVCARCTLALYIDTVFFLCKFRIRWQIARIMREFMCNLSDQNNRFGLGLSCSPWVLKAFWDLLERSPWIRWNHITVKSMHSESCQATQTYSHTTR